MITIKDVVRDDKKLQEAIGRTKRGFDYFWDMAEFENIAGLQAIIKDDLKTAAFFKQIMHATLRAYDAGNKTERTYDPGSDDAKRHSCNPPFGNYPKD